MGSEGVYFFHIPKTAGVSVWHFLEQAFPIEEICPWWLWDQLITVSRDELTKWKVFRGHLLSHLEPYLGRSLKTFTVLRNPVERTISHYYHVRRAPDHPYRTHALQLSLAEFCLHAETRHMVENYQAAYIAKSPRNPITVAKELFPADLARYELQQQLEQPDTFSDAKELFDRAEERLRNFAAIGVTENLHDSLREISEAFSCPLPAAFQPRNVNPERERVDNLDEATLALIRNLTQVDQRLYDSVVARSENSKPNSSKGYIKHRQSKMISYAQNFEDVMLHRVFRDRSRGFYIDVGAWHPVFDSVTKFFYDEGWCGINIEPNEVAYGKLVADRPRDINLQVALGEREESRPLYVFEDFGNSTFEKSSRDRFAELGHESQVSTAKVTTLKAVCEAHVRGPIDFLKIDCEGWEKFVIRGADWERFRPTVLIVEATEPGTRIPSWAEWEPTLIENARYEMVYFDGINRFYLSRECAHLRTHFELPPNFHDEITLLATVSAAEVGKGFEQERDALKQERDALRERLAELEAESAQVKTRIVELQDRDTTQAAESERLNTEIGRLNAETDRLHQELIDSQARAAELEQTLLKSRLWVGQLSQELAARKRR